jgi:hypothetical protein
MPTDIHVICPHKLNWRRIEGNVFESEDWRVATRTAEEARTSGGRFYLHEHKADPAWHGGSTTEWILVPESGRLIFRYVMDGPFRVRCREGWSQSMAIVRS